MFHRLTSIAKLQDFILLAGFNDGVFKLFDLKPLIRERPIFAKLKNVPGLYEQGRIDLGGYGIIWDETLDISAEGIYERGVQVKPNIDISDEHNRFIDNLTSLRQKAGLSQKQLAVLTGLSQPNIAKTESGKNDPTLSTLLKMLNPLGVKLTFIKN